MSDDASAQCETMRRPSDSSSRSPAPSSSAVRTHYLVALMGNEEGLKAIEAVVTRLKHSPNSESLLAELLQLLQTHAVRRPELVAKYGFKHAILHRRSLGHKGA